MRVIYRPKNDAAIEGGRLSIDSQYLVVGISIMNADGGARTAIDLRDDVGGITTVSSLDCEVISALPFSGWTISPGNENALVIWPLEFHQSDWFERLFEFEVEARADFEALCVRMASEDPI